MKDKNMPPKQKLPPMLTPKQKMIAEFILKFQEEQGYAPSQREIAAHFQFKSLGTVQNYLVRLQEHGVLSKSWNAKRSIQVSLPTPPPPTSSSQALPLLGRVAAGRPIEAIETHEKIEVPQFFIRPGKSHFVLQVQGDSMKEDGILDGDYVVLRKQTHAENGETVVALVNGEATLKRYYKKQDQVELHPANSSYKPFVFNLQEELDFRIEGLYVGLIRRIH
jgi:repressor LexA